MPDSIRILINDMAVSGIRSYDYMLHQAYLSLRSNSFLNACSQLRKSTFIDVEL